MLFRSKRWWVAWSDDVPGALTQGRTLAAAKANLRDAIRMMLQAQSPVTLPNLKDVQG